MFKGNGELASKDEVVPEVEGNKKRGLRCETSLFVSNRLFWPRLVKLVSHRKMVLPYYEKYIGSLMLRSLRARLGRNSVRETRNLYLLKVGGH